MMSYAYSLGLAACQKTSISMLDWGGGIGHYYLIGKALFPDLEINYHCKDVPVLAEYGQSLFPEAHFYTNNVSIDRTFNFVFSSCSLHYSQDWKSDLKILADVTEEYLFVTRQPIIHKFPSYVFIQRPYVYGYNTEYLGWCLNRQEFLDTAKKYGLQLIREFVTGEAPEIDHAPEPCEYRGFLFQPSYRK